MSNHGGTPGRPDSGRRDWRGSRDPLDIAPMDIIVMAILMVLLGVVLFGAISQARASSGRNDPAEVASADLNFAAQQVQNQKFLPCTSTNSEPYNLPSSALTPTATSANLAIATNSLPIAQASSAGTSHPYFAKLSAINGVSGFTWSVSPPLPSGLSLSPDGVISGVPQTESSGRYTFTVVSNGNSDSKDLSLTVVSLEVLVHDTLLKWTPCQQKLESTSPGISAEVLQTTSHHLVVAKRVVGTHRSSGGVKLAKSGNVEQIELSTRVQGQRLTRTITVSN